MESRALSTRSSLTLRKPARGQALATLLLPEAEIREAIQRIHDGTSVSSLFV